MNKFRGWKTVFSFTLKQHMGTKSYKAVTVIAGVIVFAIAVLLTVLAAKPDKEEEKASFCKVQKVYVLDLAGIGEIPYTEWAAGLPEAAYYRGLAFESVSGISEEELQAMAAKEESGMALGVVLALEDGVIQVRALVPSTSGLELNDGQEIAALVAGFVETKRLNESGLSSYQIAQIAKQVSVNILDAGGENSVLAYLIQYLAPLIFGLVLYFLLLLYGQSISQEVSTEKTSKLMETLLTSLHPYALLTGKVFAIVTSAIAQFLIWVVCIAAGLFAGIQTSRMLFPGVESSISMMVGFLRDNVGESAFSPVAVVLAFVTFACGFLFYCVLSGMAGSMVTRPEEASSVQSVFTLPIVISWLVCYMGVLLEKENVMVIARNIPFTIPFCIPVELLTGTVGIVQGIISTVILLVFSLLFIMLSARIYRGLVLYNGQKMSFKMIASVIRNK